MYKDAQFSSFQAFPISNWKSDLSHHSWTKYFFIACDIIHVLFIFFHPNLFGRCPCLQQIDPVPDLIKLRVFIFLLSTETSHKIVVEIHCRVIWDSEVNWGKKLVVSLSDYRNRIVVASSRIIVLQIQRKTKNVARYIAELSESDFLHISRISPLFAICVSVLSPRTLETAM